MCLLARRLSAAGYRVVNLGYPSRHGTVASLATVVGDGLEAGRRAGAPRIHFVTHSLGGILVRQYFQGGCPPDAGRVVMIAPPNCGTPLADRHRRTWWFACYAGPAGAELGRAPDSLPNRLGPVDLEIGVIAGGRDGKVPVGCTRLAEMRDWLVVPHAHTFIMNSREVARQAVAFLRDGRFAAAPAHS